MRPSSSAQDTPRTRRPVENGPLELHVCHAGCPAAALRLCSHESGEASQQQGGWGERHPFPHVGNQASACRVLDYGHGVDALALDGARARVSRRGRALKARHPARCASSACAGGLTRRGLAREVIQHRNRDEEHTQHEQAKQALTRDARQKHREHEHDRADATDLTHVQGASRSPRRRAGRARAPRRTCSARRRYRRLGFRRRARGAL